MTAEDTSGAPADPATTRRFVTAGLATLELEAGDDELAVIEAVDAVYRPSIRALLQAELDGVEPEPGEDMSRPPPPLERR
jgi:hypothetical protein